MLNGKQRAQLRAMANGIDTIVQVGKSGITDNLISQVEDALKARELVKGRVLDNTLLSSREVCESLCKELRAEPVQVIGSKFVIYKENHDIPKEKRIKLVK